MGKLSMELYLDKITKKYRSGSRREKSVILEDLCSISKRSLDAAKRNQG